MSAGPFPTAIATHDPVGLRVDAQDLAGPVVDAPHRAGADPQVVGRRRSGLDLLPDLARRGIDAVDRAGVAEAPDRAEAGDDGDRERVELDLAERRAVERVHMDEPSLLLAGDPKRGALERERHGRPEVARTGAAFVGDRLREVAFGRRRQRGRGRSGRGRLGGRTGRRGSCRRRAVIVRAGHRRQQRDGGNEHSENAHPAGHGGIVPTHTARSQTRSARFQPRPERTQLRRRGSTAPPRVGRNLHPPPTDQPTATSAAPLRLGVPISCRNCADSARPAQRTVAYSFSSQSVTALAKRATSLRFIARNAWTNCGPSDSMKNGSSSSASSASPRDSGIIVRSSSS